MKGRKRKKKNVNPETAVLIRRGSSVIYGSPAAKQAPLRGKANLIACKHKQAAAKCHADTHPSKPGFSASPFLLLHNHGRLTYTHYHSDCVQNFFVEGRLVCQRCSLQFEVAACNT